LNAGNWITVGIFLASLAISAAIAYYGFVRSIDHRVSVLENRTDNNQAVIDSIAMLNTRLDKVANDNEMFWRILGPHLAGIIHSPKSKERDALVDKLVRNTIDAKECRRLVTLLHEAIDSDRWDADKKLAGALLLARTEAKLKDMALKDCA